MYEDTWNELVLSENIYQSRNRKERTELYHAITHIVIHVTGNTTTEEKWFQASRDVFMSPKSTSAHYMIKEDGTITQFVKDKDVALHAGIRHNPNDSIVISNQTTVADGKICAGELYDRPSNEWKHWRFYYPKGIATYERINAFADTPTCSLKRTNRSNLYTLPNN